MIKNEQPQLNKYDEPEYTTSEDCIKIYLSNPSVSERNRLEGRYGAFDIQGTVAGYIDITEDREGINDIILIDYMGDKVRFKVVGVTNYLHPLSRTGKKTVILKKLPGRDLNDG